MATRTRSTPGAKPRTSQAATGAIQIRVTDEERALLDEGAELDGQPVSSWLRELGLERARKLKR